MKKFKTYEAACSFMSQLDQDLNFPCLFEDDGFYIVAFIDEKGEKSWLNSFMG